MKKIFISYFIAMTFICQYVIAAQDRQSCIAEATKSCVAEATKKCRPSKPSQLILNNKQSLSGTKLFLYDFNSPSIVSVRENKLSSNKSVVDLKLNNSVYPDGSYTLFTFACNGSLAPWFCKPPKVPSIGLWHNPDFVEMNFGGPVEYRSVYLKPVTPAMAAPTTDTSGRRTLSENQSYKVTGIRHTKSK